MEYKFLGELVDSISERERINYDSVVLINTSDVLEGKVLNHNLVKNHNLKGQFKKSFKYGDILFSEIRPRNKRYARIDFNSEGYIASTKLMVLRPKNDNINFDYIYKFLTSERILNELENMAESRSGTFPQITFNNLKEIEVPYPNRIIQDKICDILGSYDQKLEINNKIIANLEAQAQALFKYYFIDFEPFRDGKFIDSDLGPIPEGWEVINLGDKYPLKSGYAFKSKDLVNKGYPVIKIKNIDGGTINLSEADCIENKNIAEKASDFYVNGTEIIIALTGATTGKFGIVPKESEAYVNQRAGLFKNNNDGYGFLLGLLKQKHILDNIISMARGSAQSNLSPRDVNNFKIPYFEDEKTIIINKILNSYVEKISLLYFQNQTLAGTRDALLPKLMAGEIDLEDLGGFYD